MDIHDYKTRLVPEAGGQSGLGEWPGKAARRRSRGNWFGG